MSMFLAEIDATCGSLGLNEGSTYIAEPNVIQGLKHLIWILRRDGETHEYRRHMGRAKVLQTDLLPMFVHEAPQNDELSEVLLRLLVNLTSPTLLLYKEELPKDAAGRRCYLQLIDILQGYKVAFILQPAWEILCARLKKSLQIDTIDRSEDEGLVIERILVLIRNVLQIPANPDCDNMADNDASVHDQVLWAQQQSGILDLVLFIVGSNIENQYHLHVLEIICLLYREQTAAILAEASLNRTSVDRQRAERELVVARNREKYIATTRLPPSRHSRFGGTYVLENVKSISENAVIAHQSLKHAITMDFDHEKSKKKKSFRLIGEEAKLEHRSPMPVRLFLQEYSYEILSSAFNNFVRHVRRMLESSSSAATISGHDDSFLLWAIRFFMEFNRLRDFKLDLVSESMNVQYFHWVLTRIEHNLDMCRSDKKRSRTWAKRLHIAVQTFGELLLNLQLLGRMEDKNIQALFKMIENNIFYVLEYRETIVQLLLNYNPSYCTRAFLRDVIETTNVFLKMMEKFCSSTILVQTKKKTVTKKRTKLNKKPDQSVTQNTEPVEMVRKTATENAEDIWSCIATQIAFVLANKINIDVELVPLPFDAASDRTVDEQKDDCVKRIFSLMHMEKFEEAVTLMRMARDIWPENDCFGTSEAQCEDELLLLHEIYVADLDVTALTNVRTVVNEDNPDICGKGDGNDNDNDSGNGNDSNKGGNAGGDNGVQAYDDGNAEESDDSNANGENEVNEENDEYEMDNRRFTETEFRFDDFARRLVNPKIVRACIAVLVDWQKIPTKSLKHIVSLLHRIAFRSKMPAMLFQASLFRIFQMVLNSPRDVHSEELRKLAIFIVRKFVSLAPSNPKIYAELLFGKTIKEANDLEMGYSADYDVPKGTWSEEQEDELRRLFVENQENPATNQDVIDWILDNLIEKTRTRRGVLKKMRELGLIFKAPTKKSAKSSVDKNAWTYDQDELLKTLYDEHRLADDTLDQLMAHFAETRTKNAVIKRMIQIGVIADRAEIVPQKSRKSRPTKIVDQSTMNTNSGNSPSTSDSESESDSDSDSDGGKRQMKFPKQSSTIKHCTTANRKQMKVPLNIVNVKLLVDNCGGELEEGIAWLIESLKDAIDDMAEEASADPDDAIPLVPIAVAQKDAIENRKFHELLAAVGLQSPITGTSSYWRIPNYMTRSDLTLRCQIIAGEKPTMNTHNNAIFDNLCESESSDMYSDTERAPVEQCLDKHDDENVNFIGAHTVAGNRINTDGRRAQIINSLIYNSSDDENENGNGHSNSNDNEDTDKVHHNQPPFPIDNSKVKNEKQMTKRINTIKMNTGDKKKMSDDQNNGIHNNDNAITEFDVSSQNLRRRLAILTDSSDNSSDSDKEVDYKSTEIDKSHRKKVIIDRRIKNRNTLIDSSSDESTRESPMHNQSSGSGQQDAIESVVDSKPPYKRVRRSRSQTSDSSDGDILPSKRLKNNRRPLQIDENDD